MKKLSKENNLPGILAGLWRLLAAGAVSLPLAFQALADGTEELGDPSIAIASGSGIVAAGTGMVDQPGTIDVTVPDGATVNQVLLYWEGQMNTDVAGDDTIVIDGNDVTGILIGGQTFFAGDIYSSAYRADITDLGLISAGANTLTVNGLDFSKVANGAGVLVIFDDGSGDAEVGILDGLDLAFINLDEPQKSTIPQTFTFAPAVFDRVANFDLFFSSVSGRISGADADRPTSIEVTVGGTTTTFSNELASLDGEEWDTVNVDFDIPAGASSLKVQAFSRDDNNTGNLPASFAWIAAGLSVLPPNPGIDIEKLTNGNQADGANDDDVPQIAPADSVTWTYIVTNTGDVPFAFDEVVVTDDQSTSTGVSPEFVPGAGSDNGDTFLSPGEIWHYTASQVAENLQTSSSGVTIVDGCDPGLTGDTRPTYENIGTVVAGTETDSDPSHYCNPPDLAIACRFTGGLNDTFAGNRYQAGAQAGANTGAQPQPKGEWTHHQQGGPAGRFTFHGGTSSAPEGTEIDEIRCSDPGGCGPSGNPPSPAKQLDFDGIGTFKNIGGGNNEPDFVDAGANVTAEGNGNKDFDGTFHWFEVNIDDLGEPGNSNPNKNPDDADPATCPALGFGEKGGEELANCSCSDFYRITIYDGVDASDVVKNPDGSIDPSQMNRTKVIYEVWGYLDGGNLQIHHPTGFDSKNQ